VLALVLALATIPVHEAIGAERVIVALGDSLTAGLGVAPDEAWPALLEAQLHRAGSEYRVVNAGVSGDTSAGGLARLDWVLRNDPEIVIVALGANDGLRGQPVSALRANLLAIVERLKKRNVKVLLAGMRLPPNYGAAYTGDFAAVFVDVARRTGVPLVPFLLDGVAANTSQPGRRHSSQPCRASRHRRAPLAVSSAVADGGALRIASREAHGVDVKRLGAASRPLRRDYPDQPTAPSEVNCSGWPGTRESPSIAKRCADAASHAVALARAAGHHAQGSPE